MNIYTSYIYPFEKSFLSYIYPFLFSRNRFNNKRLFQTSVEVLVDLENQNAMAKSSLGNLVLCLAFLVALRCFSTTFVGPSTPKTQSQQRRVALRSAEEVILKKGKMMRFFRVNLSLCFVFLADFLFSKWREVFVEKMLFFLGGGEFVLFFLGRCFILFYLQMGRGF